MKIAVIWSRFGPYHLARLRGAAEAGANCGIAIVGLEVARHDRQYDWDVRLGAGDFQRQTVFGDGNYHDLTAKVIAAGVAKTLNEIRPDGVAINGWSVPEARAAIDWCYRRPHVTAVLMSETKEDDAKRVWWKEALKKRIVNRCDAALVGGRAQRDYLAKLGFPRERIFSGYDVVDNDHFARGSAKARAEETRLRTEAKLPERYFFACTRFIARKNIDGLLRAYDVYRRESAEEAWGLVIAGGGEEEARYRQLERQLGLDGVQWPGFVQYDRLPLYYGLASAFVHPALTEAWGLVVNEALACGLPLLVSRNVGASYELLRDGENGYAFNPDSFDDLAGRMLALTRMSEPDRAAMSGVARRIAAEWTPKRFGEGLLAATKSMVASRSQ